MSLLEALVALSVMVSVLTSGLYQLHHSFQKHTAYFSARVMASHLDLLRLEAICHDEDRVLQSDLQGDYPPFSLNRLQGIGFKPNGNTKYAGTLTLLSPQVQTKVSLGIGLSPTRIVQ